MIAVSWSAVTAPGFADETGVSKFVRTSSSNIHENGLWIHFNWAVNAFARLVPTLSGVPAPKRPDPVVPSVDGTKSETSMRL